MRIALRSLTVAVLAALFGSAGCTKNPGANDGKDAKAAEIAKVEKQDKVKKDDAPKKDAKGVEDAKTPQAKDPPAKDPTPKDPAAKDVVVKDPEPEPTPKRLDITVVDVKPGDPKTVIPVVDTKDTKKKDKGKDKDKDKEPAKDPKTGEFKEPTEVGGKTWKQWMVEMKSRDPGKREAAMKAVLNFGPNKAYEAVPEIIAELNKHTASAPVDLAVRVNGIMALSTIFKYKEKPETKHVQDAFTIYKRFLNDEQVILRVRTLQGLPMLGQISRGALDEVIKQTKEPSTWEVRKEAMQVMVLLGGPDGKGAGPNAKAIAALKYPLERVGVDKFPRETSYFVRDTAVQGLAILSQGSGKVPVEFRTTALTDPSVVVRLSTLQAIMALKPEMDLKKDLPIWVKALNEHLAVENDDVLKIWTHATIMVLIENPSEAHMKPLVAFLTKKASEPHIKVQALTVIAQFGEKSKKHKFVLDGVMSALQTALADKEKEGPVISAAYITLARMNHWDPIIAKLNDKKETSATRIQALQLMGSSGPPAKPYVLKAVVDALSDKDLDIADAAVLALVALHATEAISNLQTIASDAKADEELRDACKEAIQTLKKNESEMKKKKTP
jgi:HEAT repeat protein